MMHWTLQLTLMLVIWACIGGLWRHSALALIGAWGIGQAVYLTTGNSLPIPLYWLTDAVVICIIFGYIGSKLDYVIMALFVACWWAYSTKEGTEQWWILWAISSLQFFLAGPWPQLQQIIYSISHGPRRALA